MATKITNREGYSEVDDQQQTNEDRKDENAEEAIFYGPEDMMGSSRIINHDGEQTSGQESSGETTVIDEGTKKGTPLWAWVALAVAVLACSSGGAWFALLGDCPPILRASWRLWITAFLQIPGWIRDILKMDEAFRKKYIKSMLQLMVAGTALAVHFSSWSVSLTLTSLSHSLLFVCTTPILLVLYQGTCWLVCRRYSDNHPHPPTWIEIAGTIIGFVAAVLLAREASAHSDDGNVGSSSEAKYQTPSLIGDLVATLGAATMGIYLISGASMRKWLSIWLYAFPVTLISAIASMLLSLIIEREVTIYGVSRNSILGLLGSPERFGLVFGAAFTSGILGHTLANLVLEYISPLVVSVSLLNEPLFGSVIGYLIGVQGPPSLVTCLTGIPLMVSAGLVSLGGRDGVLYQKWKTKRNNNKFRVINEAEQSDREVVVT